MYKLQDMTLLAGIPEIKLCFQDIDLLLCHLAISVNMLESNMLKVTYSGAKDWILS